MANLIDLDHHLRRVGRNNQHIGMSLDEEPGFFLVRVAQIFASLDGFGKTGVEIGGLSDAGAVRALSAEIRQAIGLSRRQAVQSLREHQRQRVLARSLRARKNDGVRKALARQHIAQAMDGFGVAMKIRKAHEARLVLPIGIRS